MQMNVKVFPIFVLPPTVNSFFHLFFIVSFAQCENVCAWGVRDREKERSVVRTPVCVRVCVIALQLCVRSCSTI